MQICRDLLTCIPAFTGAIMDNSKEIPIRVNSASSPFLNGMASLFDFTGALDEYDAAYFEEFAEKIRARWLSEPGGPAADAEAIHECWVEVGNCLRGVMSMPLVDPSKKRQLRMAARKQRNELGG